MILEVAAADESSGVIRQPGGDSSGDVEIARLMKLHCSQEFVRVLIRSTSPRSIPGLPSRTVASVRSPSLASA